MAGSEFTFSEMMKVFPGADHWALSVAPGMRTAFPGIRTTILDRSILRSRRSVTLPLMPAAWALARRGTNYDVVVTSSHAFARVFAGSGERVHCCYVYAPARYLWTPEIDQRGAGRLRAPVRALLRRLDLRSVQGVDSFASISTEVAARVLRYYGRASTVIHPPVDTQFFTPADGASRERYLLSVGRLIGYKRHDLAIETGATLGMDVVVAGTGPEEESLRELAARSHPGRVVFEVGPPRERIRDLMRSATALIFGGREDFGIVPVEAQACGTPVVAWARGGVLDTVEDGVSGVLVDRQSPEDFALAIEELRRRSDPAGCRRSAERFGVEDFRRRFEDWVEGAVRDRGGL